LDFGFSIFDLKRSAIESRQSAIENPMEECVMRKGRRRIYVLDCPFCAWSAQRRQEIMLQHQIAPAPAPKVLPFTFKDVPPVMADEKRVVLKPNGGVKS
jgi:hypothetical protein